MRIAHLSDLHVLDLAGVPARRIFTTKRVTGWFNLRFHRGSVHRREVVEALVADVARANVDHVVVTGDLTNLALETEFAAAREVLAGLGMSSDAVSVIPGNHDVYTRGSHRAKRFEKYFGAFTTSDPGFEHAGGYPFVRLRGPVAIVGLSTAVPRVPLLSSGYTGLVQRRALDAVLARPEVASRTAVVLGHHPLVNPLSALRKYLRGFDEADEVRALLGQHARVISLHGHLHERLHHRATTPLGVLDIVGATSASLVHPVERRMAGYNLYDIDETGLIGVEAHVWQPGETRLRRAVIPVVPLA